MRKFTGAAVSAWQGAVATTASDWMAATTNERRKHLMA
jgi:hypothetical protein